LLKSQRDELVLAWIVWTVYNALWKNVLEWLANNKASVEDRKKLEDYISWQASKKINSLSNTDYNAIIGVHLLWVARIWGQSILDQLGSRKDFTIWVWLEKIIGQRIGTLIKWLDKTTMNKLAKNMVTGLENGLTMKQMTGSLIKLWKEIARDRAWIIMTTESNSLLQFVRHEMARLNWAETKTWEAVADERTCWPCNNLNGLTVRIEDTFDWVDNPPLHPNCRCWVSYDFTKRPQDVVDSF
jgi:SPP1 gp7 family putative phage head morphogenesis protein